MFMSHYYLERAMYDRQKSLQEEARRLSMARLANLGDDEQPAVAGAGVESEPRRRVLPAPTRPLPTARPTAWRRVASGLGRSLVSVGRRLERAACP